MKRIFVVAALIIQTLWFQSVDAQSYEKILSRQKVVINYDDHTVVTYTEPVEKVSLNNDCYYYWLSGQNINVTQGGFSGKLLNGSFEAFYLDKNLKESGWFLNGLKVGDWKHWNESGVLIDQYVWKDGKKDGQYRRYDANGREIEYGSYQHDLLDGKQVVVGDSTQVTYYKHGKVIQHHQLMPKFINKIIHPAKSTK
jgi:antitoxin component YwqK of YwqJK toxin-antitoxin module